MRDLRRNISTQELERQLRSIQQDWERLNRPHVNSALKTSIKTKMEELASVIKVRKRLEATASRKK